MITDRASRIPPHSEDAERGIIGAALLDAERVVPLAQSRGLDADAFYIPAHRIMWRGIVAVCESKHGQCDSLLLADHLTRTGELEAIEGHGYIDRMIDGCPTTAHAEHYLNMVQGKYLARLVIQAARTAEQAAYEQEDAEAVRSAAEMDFARIGDRETAEPKFAEVVDSVIAALETVMVSGVPQVNALSTGYPRLDTITEGGLRVGNAYFVKGDACSGKTTLVCNIAVNVALAGSSVFIVSAEMRARDIVEKLLSIRVRSSVQRALAGKYPLRSEEVQEASAVLRERIHIQTRIKSLEHVWGACRRAVRKDKCKLVAIDYLQLVATRGPGEKMWDRISNASTDAVMLAGELGVPFLIVSQADEDESSLKMRGSRQTQFDAAGIWHVHKDKDAIVEPPDFRRPVDVEIAKARFSAYGVRVPFTLIGSTGEMVENR